jgi:hypothetical protein
MLKPKRLSMTRLLQYDRERAVSMIQAGMTHQAVANKKERIKDRKIVHMVHF